MNDLRSCVMCLAMLCSAVAGAADDAEILFARHVGPLLREKCAGCHGAEPDKLQGALDVRSRPAVLNGGESGQPAIVPGKPDASPLYLAVTRQHAEWSAMPPKEAERLTLEQTAWIRDWVAGGAPWPDPDRVTQLLQSDQSRGMAVDEITVVTSGGQSADWASRRYKREGLWGYQPVRKPDVHAAGSRAIDALLAAVRPADLPIAPAADRGTLIRRASFALTGLPPSLDEIAAFLQDAGTDAEAFDRVIERLLASPHYGEHMAQHWLDVVRYADSSGFANDFERGNAWRYRDYVVRSFNADKPYDQFVREQIAGDEMDPQNPEFLVATGFLRMGPWELTGMEVAKIARQRFLDDVTNSVGETFLSHSLQCARCHDHKFDPVSTGDYYSIQAVFATTQLAERPAAFLSAENTNGFEERVFLEQREADYRAMLKQLDDKLLQSAQEWFAAKSMDPAVWNAAVEKARNQSRNPSRDGRRRDAESLFNSARSMLTAQGVPEDQFPPKLYGFSPADYGNERVARKGLERLKWELERYEPIALSVYCGRTPDVKSVVAPVRMPADRLSSGELENTCVLVGGDPFSPGAAVQPGVLSILNNVPHEPIPESIDGRRRAFAEWVASTDNSLTTRSIVNRLWMWHFQQPLAGNPNNFGSTGKRPTHPELLDWLAATLVEEGWSVKSMHRLIMRSAAWQRSTEHPDRRQLAERDPLGVTYSVFQPRRLSAEELRDAMLAATGELNLTIGGIPNRPEINPEAALQPRQVMGTFAAAWTPNPLPQQRHRRSLYALKIRGLRDPFLEVFNAPPHDFSCERRESSMVTPQVFSLFNSEASYSRALALAMRAVRESETDDQAIDRCFQRAFGRPATAEERAVCRTHWTSMRAMPSEYSLPAPVRPLEIRRDAVEENTGEKFSFQEKLYSMAEFVADPAASDVDVRTRALADICLALFNSSEFAYVY